MSSDERICCLALTRIPGIGRVSAKRLIDSIGSAADVFRLRSELPNRIPGATPSLVEALNCPEAFARAEQEMAFVEKHRLACLTLTDECYPHRLRECDDAPVILFFKGNADLNSRHIISIVGTRQASDYGKQFCNTFLRDLQALCPDVLVVSGLAYGIDICAHRAALACQLPTLAVLAHGLDRIYPYTHRRTAVDMLSSGGLLTEYPSDTKPDRFNFVARNRIVAGLADAVIVVESAEKGGSLITADLANGYHHDCFAVPGNIDLPFSKGCNALIRDNKAALLQSADELVQAMGWGETTAGKQPVQQELFPELTDEEKQVVKLLTGRGDLHINELVVATGIPVYRMSAMLFELEMKGVTRTLVGGRYKMM
ncbi:MAG: DNA-processing protein DprA [Prevotellaceae bacterium]|jgi:DNA processing protein|nr:DNA-processing protein DprA [Prevotellaceae bacterium]